MEISSSSSDLNPKTPSRINQLIPGFNSYHPSPSRTIYSDRFIPSRSSSNFALFDLPLPPHSSSSEDSSNAYTSLLRSALFGSDCGSVVPPVTPEKSSGLNSRNLQISRPNCNIFRYKSETRQSLQSLSPFGYDDQLPGFSPSPVKATRKVPRSPFKVLDAPALQDDFYLNLVDWSPNNVLAVGLGSCVYLWHASSSKVVKLCDLGIDDSVSSVGWAQRGTHLAVGTSNGKVQGLSEGKCISWHQCYCHMQKKCLCKTKFFLHHLHDVKIFRVLNLFFPNEEEATWGLKTFVGISLRNP